MPLFEPMNHLSRQLRRSFSILPVFLIVFGLAVSVSAQRRSISETDIFKFVWVADPQISPDGSQVAFVRVSVDEKKDQYDTSIWIAKADGSEPPRQLTAGLRDASPRWSPDGRRLAFTRIVDKDGRPQPPQIYALAMAGGEPRALTDIPRGAGNPEWSPDGQTIAFASGAKPDDLKKDPKAEKPRESDVRVVTSAVYRANGVPGFGYVDPERPAQIWTVAVSPSATEMATPRSITTGEFATGNMQWSADGSQILFVSNRQRDAYYQPADSDLYAVSKEGGEPTRIATIDGNIGCVCDRTRR